MATLTESQLATLKDIVLLRLVLDQGGSYRMEHQEVLRMADELQGWGVMLRADEREMVLRVETPESRQ